MAILKCKMCGGDLEIQENVSVCECEYCGTKQTVPNADDEKKISLFGRANRLRLACEFDKAAGVYESIVSEFPEEAEGYWGLVLCAYGIEYVDDPATGKKIPTCHRTVTASVMDDSNFELALENADLLAKKIYREEAKEIDSIQKNIFSIVGNEEPYDVFICYKETDDISGKRTEDSLIAQDIYTELIKDGYKVFFSRVSLREKAGTEYEPYIYAALSSAKVMLAIGTKFEYYDAVWVKNEWSRYISMMADDSSKHLIPCFKNLDAYDIPKEFKNLQALDMGEVTFFKNLAQNISKFIPKESGVSSHNSAFGGESAALLKRAFMFLEDGEWQSADEYCEKVLDIEPECAEAYLGKFMVTYKLNSINNAKKIAEISNGKKCCEFFDSDANMKKFFRFADAEERETINKISDAVDKELEIIAEENIKKIEQKRNDLKKAEGVLSAGRGFTACLKTDGTVVATDVYAFGRCNVKSWDGIVAVSVGALHAVGLKTDGTVVATGINSCGQCDVESWDGIVAVSAGGIHTVGLRSDGTVVAAGDNKHGQCNVENWDCVVAVSAGNDYTVGLRSDGTVVAIGKNIFGQCDVESWDGIVAVSAGSFHTAGLRSDGTVVVTDRNSFDRRKIESLDSIVAVSAGNNYTVGLRSDGTVAAIGRNTFNCCDVESWDSIVAISAGEYHTVGLRLDGTVVAVGQNDSCECNVEGFKLFDSFDNYEAERKMKIEEKRKTEELERQKEEAKRRNAEELENLKSARRSECKCQHCGGELKGLFSKKCVNCGKPKDY